MDVQYNQSNKQAHKIGKASLSHIVIVFSVGNPFVIPTTSFSFIVSSVHRIDVLFEGSSLSPGLADEADNSDGLENQKQEENARQGDEAKQECVCFTWREFFRAPAFPVAT